jgi:hypothetical protein
MVRLTVAALGLLAFCAAASLFAQDRPPSDNPKDENPKEKIDKRALEEQEQIERERLLERERARLERQRALLIESRAALGQKEAGPRFNFQIDPETPLKELLPVPPQMAKVRPVTVDDPQQVPELQFQQALPKDLPADKVLEQTALTIARVNHVNKKERDAFIKALREQRTDLAGLHFAMGDACRTKGEHSRQFALAVDLVRRSMSENPNVGDGAPGSIIDQQGDPSPAAAFWERFRVNCQAEDANVHRVDRERQEIITVARIAALMQILAPEAPSVRLGLVRYLSSVSHVEATRALAKMALFSPEEDVRLAAIQGLKVRRERDYTDILEAGLRYPWPAVAKRAADAIVKLERVDMIPALIDVLDRPDPRAPVVQETGGKKVHVANELVRVNHHRNCLLCHAPGNTEEVSAETLTAGMPLTSEPLGSAAGPYRRSIPDILVRIDVTYLRQDFSMTLPVADAAPWPEMQRFDFLVRTRELSDEDVAVYREQYGTNDPTRPNAYQRAALGALREMTGRDAAPTAEAWRTMLDLKRK